MAKFYLVPDYRLIIEAEPVEELILKQDNEYNSSCFFRVINPEYVKRNWPTFSALYIRELDEKYGPARKLDQKVPADKAILELKLPTVDYRIRYLNIARNSVSEFWDTGLKIKDQIYTYSQEGISQILTDFQKELKREKMPEIQTNLKAVINFLENRLNELKQLMVYATEQSLPQLRF